MGDRLDIHAWLNLKYNIGIRNIFPLEQICSCQIALEWCWFSYHVRDSERNFWIQNSCFKKNSYILTHLCLFSSFIKPYQRNNNTCRILHSKSSETKRDAPGWYRGRSFQKDRTICGHAALYPDVLRSERMRRCTVVWQELLRCSML